MRRRHPELLAVAWLLTGLLLLVGLAGVVLVSNVAEGEGEERAPRLAGETGFQRDPPALNEPPAVRLDAAAPRRSASRHVGRAPRPVWIAIPAIGVSAPVVPLGLDRTGALEVPRDFADTGWWTGGARPGERGPAVIAGHVDSSTGPAVFFRLGELRSGDAITVERVDGSSVRFRVERSGRYPKDRFPTAQVYGSTRAPALRLITCSGTFDRATGHYLDNTVVYAGR
jgi:sortase family protein